MISIDLYNELQQKIKELNISIKKLRAERENTMTIIIKKEINDSWSSLKRIIHCKTKIVAKILKFYWKRKGYEIEEMEE